MNPYELTEKIHKQLCHDILTKEVEDDYLKLLEELEKFCSVASAEELEILHKECFGGEMFARIAMSIKYERIRLAKFDE